MGILSLNKTVDKRARRCVRGLPAVLTFVMAEGILRRVFTVPLWNRKKEAIMPRLSYSFKALRELGLRPAIQILTYRLANKSGWYRRRVQPPASIEGAEVNRLPFLQYAVPNTRPAEELASRIQALLDGEVTCFGAVRLPLDFQVPGPLRHWSYHEQSWVHGRDIKFFWEPARFSWVADLVMTYRAAPDPQLPEFFSRQLNAFMAANPPYQGPHWANGQEVGLRLMNILLAYSVFGDAMADPSELLAQHAARIPPTLVYARAQANNHLLSEAAALFTAGLVLKGHPEAEHWYLTGWRTFCRAVVDQFAPDGTYMQQSTSYHRLALQLALWVHAAAGAAELSLPDECRSRLAAATRRLLAYCDPATGEVPNLGPNDGAYIFPLSSCAFSDYRPLLQAAARAFLGGPAFEPGPWDDMSAWFGLSVSQADTLPAEDHAAFGMLQHPALPSRAGLRAAVFSHRPGHADQLHVDLWLQDLYLASDPGTFQYNAEPPWDNPLVAAKFHNTLTIDGLDQMTRASRFLYVDRAEGRYQEIHPGRLTASHNGYRSLGLVHERTLRAVTDGWKIEDIVQGDPAQAHLLRLHWLLPDMPWRLDGSSIRLETPHGPVLLRISLPDDVSEFTIMLARAGETLIGPRVLPTEGWFSPTYAVKVPALSFSIEIESAAPIKLESDWIFSESH